MAAKLHGQLESFAMSNASAKPQSFTPDVREHYEELPYPFRDPEKEGEEFQGADGISIDALSHYGWEGKRDLRHGARFLIAGCGTGDMAIGYAEEIIHGDSEIVAIDFSKTSLDIAKARMKKRGLNNVTFHHMSILDLPTAGLGQFDVIECSGVLHHLPDPNAGLAALAGMLKEDGLMTVMVYAQYGRMALYMVQDLMKQLMTTDTPRTRKIEIAREFLNMVPPGHWLTTNNANFLNDMSWADGSGIYDLFLHAVDRAYTVPRIYDWVEGAGLTLVDLFGEFTNSSSYNPDNYTHSSTLREIFATKSPRERHTIAELMHGHMQKHHFHAAKQPKKQAQLAEDMVMSFGPMQWVFHSFVQAMLEGLKTAPLGACVEGKARVFATSPMLRITKTCHVETFLNLIDGKKTIAEMVAIAMQTTGADMKAVAADLNTLYHELFSQHLVFLRHQSIPPYVTGPETINRMRTHLGIAGDAKKNKG
jgi:2-polyprenyl-3-methyl-5-hydroxy-6-metoxy-1,4-benzoquinol methylase